MPIHEFVSIIVHPAGASVRPWLRKPLLLICLGLPLFSLSPEAIALNGPLYLKGGGVPGGTLSDVAPTASTLPNYDPGRDDEPGLLLAKSGEGLSETDATKYQLWATASGKTLNGPTTLTFWSAMKDFGTGKRGIVDAGLYDCNKPQTSCSLIAQGQRDVADWSGGTTTWVERTIDFGNLSYSISPGHTLALKVVVGNDSDDDMWFAYDTVSYASRLGEEGPEMMLLKSVSAAVAAPGDTLIYTLVHTNDGPVDVFPEQTVDPIPANTDYQVASTTFSPGTSGLSVVIEYSPDGELSWGYSPVSGGGGAPVGFDRNVTHIRYTFSGTLINVAPDNTFVVTFGVQIR